MGFNGGLIGFDEILLDLNGGLMVSNGIYPMVMTNSLLLKMAFYR